MLKGVVNLIIGCGFDLGNYMLVYLGFDKLVFIGLIEVGYIVVKVVVDCLILVILEFGGKLVNIIFEDVNWECVLEGV